VLRYSSLRSFDKSARAKVYGSDEYASVSLWIIATPDCASTLGMILIASAAARRAIAHCMCMYVHAFIRPSRIRGRCVTSVPDTYTYKHQNSYTLDKSMRHGDSLQGYRTLLCVSTRRKKSVNAWRATREEERNYAWWKFPGSLKQRGQA